MPRNKNNEREEFSKKLLSKLAADNKKPKKYQHNFRLPLFHFWHRLWHILFIIPFLPFIWILHLVLIFRFIFTSKPIFYTQECYGKKGNLIIIKYFNSNIGSNFALFYHVLSGKLNLIGYSLNTLRELGDSFIYDYAPGVINLWYIRSASRTAYEGIKETDKEFVSTLLLKAELNPDIISFIKLIKAEFLLMIRFLVAGIFRTFQKVKHLPGMIDPIFLFNTRLRNVSMQQTMDQIKSTINNNGGNSVIAKRKIYFVNPDCFNKTFSPALVDYKAILSESNLEDWIFADGIGINIAVDMLGYPKNENINGTDLLPRLVELAAANDFSLFLLGAKEGIAVTMKEKLISQYPDLQIKGTQHGYFDWDAQSADIVQKINDLQVDILLVAFGAPHQERWIEKWFPHLNCSLVIGVGGLFDFYSGRMKRAPRWLRDIGLEWVFRLLMEPRRMFKRYIIGNPLFLRRVKKIQMTAAWLTRRIMQTKKHRNLQVIDFDNLDLIKKRNTGFVDIFPMIADFCSSKQISISLVTNDQVISENCSQNLSHIFPQNNFICGFPAHKEPFYLIIAESIVPQQIGALRKAGISAICLIDKRFINEFIHIKILE
ncbi:MAG: WecB/TagA/CpsF family glycosyltransferase [Candidatus Stygibacter frigidus]|nr:WecB/TagA/CpsF family glycosyltransferase [Candidatus Stygibacter frigidus]